LPASFAGRTFETRNPQINWAQEWSTRPPKLHRLPDCELEETLEITSAHGEFISFRTRFRRAHETMATDSTLRFPPREHFESLLNKSALAVRKVLGDWTGGKFDPARSREIIVVAEKTS